MIRKILQLSLAGMAMMMMMGCLGTSTNNMISNLADGIVAGRALLEGMSDNSGITILLEPLDSSGATASLSAISRLPSDERGKLRAVSSSLPAPYTAMTNTDGEFTISSIKAGKYLLTATKTGYGRAYDPAVQVKPNLVTTVTVGLATPAVISGVVQYPEKEDHSGILVYIEGTSTFTVTDAMGNYAFSDLSAGDWTVVIKEFGYRTSRKQLSLESGVATEIEPIVLIPLGLAGTGGITGRIIDKANNAIDNAEIRVGNIVAYTGKDGLFTLNEIMAGAHDLLINAKYTGKTVSAVEVNGGDTTILPDIVLDTNDQIYGVISGKVQPAGMEADICVLENGALLISRKVNEDGTFRIRDLRAGKYRIEAVAVGYVTGILASDYKVAAGITYNLEDITLSRAPGIISGTIRNILGQPIEGATVKVGQNYETSTGTDGRYWLSVPEGKWDLVIIKTGYLPNSEIKSVSVNSGAETAGHDGVLATMPPNTIIDELDLPNIPSNILAGSGDMVYISFSSVSKVGFFDITTGNFTKFVDTGSNPRGMALNKENSRLFVACEYGDTITVINTITGIVIENINTGSGSGPVACAITENNKLYCALSGKDEVAMINAQGVVTKFIATSKGPVDLALSASSQSLFVACSNGGRIERIDINTDENVQSLASAPRPVSLSISGNRLYSACISGSSMTVVSLSENKVLGTYTTGLSPISVVADGNNGIYISNFASGSISVFDTSSLTIIRTVSVGSEPGDMAVLPNSQVLVLRPSAKKMVVLSKP